VFSDDIFMAALSENGYPPERAALSAIEAGVDVIMISEKKFAREHALLVARAMEDEAFARRIEESARRVIDFKIERGILSLEKRDDVWRVVQNSTAPYAGSVFQSVGTSSSGGSVSQSTAALRYGGAVRIGAGQARAEAFRIAKKENDTLVAEVYSGKRARASETDTDRNSKR
jgi:hypothetical protein